MWDWQDAWARVHIAEVVPLPSRRSGPRDQDSGAAFAALGAFSLTLTPADAGGGSLWSRFPSGEEVDRRTKQAFTPCSGRPKPATCTGRARLKKRVETARVRLAARMRRR